MTVTLFVEATIKPGQQAAAVAAAAELKIHMDRLGAPRGRAWINQNGENPNHQWFGMWEFETNGALGSYLDRAAGDPEMAAYFQQLYQPENFPFEPGAFATMHLREVDLP